MALDSSAEICDDRSNNPLSRKLNRILESRLDTDKETLDALKVLSSFFPENNLRNRRNLRGDIEKRSLLINDEFLQSFKEMKQVLDEFCEDIVAMNKCCNEMITRLKDTKSQTEDLISKTTKLQTESQKVQMNQELVKAFLNTFQLTSDEIKILRGTRDLTLDKQFFECLTKVKRIHCDCKVLLRSSQQTAGIEIMESMALLQETAYERLYRWTQNECRLLSAEVPDLNPLLCEALESLLDRPVLFKYTVDEYSNARRSTVVRSFIDALTRGGPGGMPRPIEFHSDEPLRYVGDMLAWLHQTLALEKELLQALLKKALFDEQRHDIYDSMSNISEGLCRPLKVRIEQVIVSEPGTVALFKLCSLLKFYFMTISQVIPSGAPLSKIIEEMHILCQKMFYNSLSCYCSHLLEKVEIPPANLGPMEALNQSMLLLREILSCQDACLVSVDDRQKDVIQILNTVIDPLMQMCHVSASKLTTCDMAVYLANCIYRVHSTLALFEFSDHHLEMLQAQMDAHLDTLVNEQASSIVSHVGLGSLYTCLQDYQPKQGPLSNLAGCYPLAVQLAVKKLDVFLSSPDCMAIPQSALLLSSSLRQSLRKRSMEQFSKAYQKIYEAIHNPTNRYPDASSLLPKTPEQVMALIL